MTATEQRSGPVVVVYSDGAATPLEIAADLDAPDGHRRDIVFAIRPDRMTAGLPELMEAVAPVVDVTDETAGVARLAALGAVGITTFSDRDLALTARLAVSLGLRFHSADTAAACADKYRQRCRLRDAGLPVPRFRPGTTAGEIAAAVTEVGTPAVLKPLHGAGSRHVYRIGSADEAARHAADVFAEGRDTTLLVEQMLVGAPEVAGPEYGDYVSVELLLRTGEPVLAEVTGKLPLTPPFRETGHFQPSTLRAADRDAAVSVARDACRALELRDGWTHTELKLTAEGPTVIEVNGRLGGHVAMLLRESAGIGAVGLALDVAAGVPVTTSVRRHRAAYSYQVLPPIGAERLVSYGRLAELGARDDVGSVMLMASPGDPVDWRQGTYGVLAMVDGAVEGSGTLLPVLDEIAACAAREIECTAASGARVALPSRSHGDGECLEAP